MTLLYLDGFDGASATTDTGSEDDVEAYLDARYTTPTWNSHGPQLYDGWGGGKALTFGDNGAASTNYIRFELAETQTTVIGFAIRPHVGVNATLDQQMLSFRHVADGRQHVTVWLTAGVHLEFRKGTGTVIANVQNVCRKSYWSYIEVKVLISDTVGTIDVQVNGVSVAALTGLDTRDLGSGDDIDAIDLIGIDGNTSNETSVCLFDDVYVLDTAGSSPTNDFLGPTKVEEILPDGAGDNADWTPSAGSNYQNVDETPRDDDTTYNESSTSTNLDLFTGAALALIDGTVFGVQIHALGRITDATTFTLVPTVKSVATEAADGGKLITDQVDYEAALGMFEDDPDAAAAWTPTTVNAMQIGYEVG